MIKLLHVDDDFDILEIAKISLEIDGDIEVTACSSGKAALLVVENYTPDILLLDYMMPDLTGPETLKELRKFSRLETVPAVFMTARAHENEHEELWEMGAIDVISKPFDPLTLGARIKEALSEAD